MSIQQLVLHLHDEMDPRFNQHVLLALGVTRDNPIGALPMVRCFLQLPPFALREVALTA